MGQFSDTFGQFAGTALLFLFTLVELLLFKYVKKVEIPWREVVYNLNSGHLVMWLFRAVEVVIFYFVLTHFSLGWVGTWPVAAQWIFTFFAWDFCFYWLHRLHHKIPILWSIHVVHHYGEHFGLTLGIRNSWYSSLGSIPFFIILAVLGVPINVFVTIAGFHYFVQFYNHNGIVKSSGLLEHFMVTPALHRVHHGCNDEYLDKNCGGTLNIWDRLFGTYQREIEGVPIKYGTREPLITDNPFWGNNIPVMDYLKMKRPVIGHPDDNKNITEDSFIASSGILLFVVLMYYIYCFGQAPGLQQFYLFMLTVSATVALGGLSDGKYWGILSWVIIATFSPIAYIWTYHIFDPTALLIFGCLVLHGLYALKYIFNFNSKENLNRVEA